MTGTLQGCWRGCCHPYCSELTFTTTRAGGRWHTRLSNEETEAQRDPVALLSFFSKRQSRGSVQTCAIAMSLSHTLSLTALGLLLCWYTSPKHRPSAESTLPSRTPAAAQVLAQQSGAGPKNTVLGWGRRPSQPST